MTATPPPDVEGFLRLLAAEPTLLPPAPADGIGDATRRRTQDEIHSCLRCGRRAQEAFIAGTRLGPRWLDLCAACGHWLRTSAP
ncbi:hypothetical protein Drose_05580 [Dactylosporangium roseum]|uniref:GATA-type domain-containing protein n=1 Tax=Dactylosporangium roseum TaxID=47989 RepID=A0ABY5Z9T1_9ACTN|nr:hypothetical protein [Dactylosporangium roseum]UWZ37740.1 hypothetical protein Drose_05580 [Dactylosporangium roseum]